MNKPIKKIVKKIIVSTQDLDCQLIGNSGECGKKCYIYMLGNCKHVEEIIIEENETIHS